MGVFADQDQFTSFEPSLVIVSTTCGIELLLDLLTLVADLFTHFMGFDRPCLCPSQVFNDTFRGEPAS